MLTIDKILPFLNNEFIEDASKNKKTFLKGTELFKRGYQKLGVQWLSHLFENGLGGILADDMGLGKTLQTLSFIATNKEKIKNPVLIVVPTSLVYNWKQEIDLFTPQLKVAIIDGAPSKRKNLIKNLHKYDVVITSYTLLKKDIDFYKELEFSICIADEAQNIKNPYSQNAEALKSLNAKTRFALTGTPIENSLSELWSIFDFVLPGFLGSYNSFKEKFEKPISSGNQATLQKLRKIISPFILRRIKTEVLNELPEKIESFVYAEMTSEQKKIYSAYLKNAKMEIENEIKRNGFEKSQIKILSILTRLRQICCHPAIFLEDYHKGSGKLELLQELISDALEANHRIIVYSQWVEMLQIIRKMLNDLNYEYFYLDGSTKSDERIDMVNKFNSGERSIFLISLKAGGFGLNITGADIVIHYDPWWNPAVEEQAAARAHRIGQKNVVQIYKLIAKDSIEEKIVKLQQKKKDLFDSVITANQTFLSKLTKEEIMELLE